MRNCFRLTLLVQCRIVFSALSIVADKNIAQNPRKIGFGRFLGTRPLPILKKFKFKMAVYSQVKQALYNNQGMNSLLEPIASDDMQQFCVEMMKRLDIQRKNESFCDVILDVGSGDGKARLKAHGNVLCAASPFFYSALTNDMKEKKDGVIRLEETNKTTMEKVLEFVYTGRVEVTQYDAFDLLETAEFFIIPSLKCAAGKFISQNLLTPSNCITLYYSAQRYQCPELQQKARNCIFENFVSVTGCEEFQNLSMEQVEEWISSDEIRVNEEEDVFKVITGWMEENKRKEQERFFELFRHVRILYMSPTYVVNEVLSCPLVKGSETCTAFVQDAIKDVSTGTEECYFAQPPRICLKKFEDCLVGCGKEKLYGYVPTENRWYEMANYLSPKLFPFHMAACDGKLYVTGGTFNPHQSTIEEYNPSRNSWTRLNSYTSAIACILPAVVNFQGSLFVIGGKKEQQRNKEKGSNRVYKYSPDTDHWQVLASLRVGRSSICAVADRNSLYAIGGESNNERLDVVESYDPHRNSWHKHARTLEKKAHSFGAIFRGKVYVFGGFKSRQFDSCSSLIEMYDPDSNTWTGIESTGIPTWPFGVVSFKGDLLVLGWWRRHLTQNCSLKVYDVDSNEWKHEAVDPSKPNGFNLTNLAPIRIPRDILNECRVVSKEHL